MKFPVAATMATLASLLRTTSSFTHPSSFRRPASLLLSPTIRTRHQLSTTTPEAGTETTPESPPKKQQRTRVLSGVQPTGSLHLGNYLGAIRQWVKYQDDNPDSENFFCVVDLHAITVPQDPATLSENTLSSAALYLAAGIDPTKSRVFIQSHVSAHAELAWLLNCITPMNWLERMIQFKDKAKKSGGTEGVGVGLFTYPVLMAADIILYQASHVPVGEDQRQHLELSRDIVRRFNDNYCKGNQFKKRCKSVGIPSRAVFVEPNAMIVKEGARIMSLTDGTSKMSKSDENDFSRINVLDPPKTIHDKIKRCKTDQIRGIEWDNPERPEATNLLNIYLAVQPDKTRQEIEEEVRDLSWGEFKPLLAAAVVRHLEPIQNRYKELREDDEALRRILREGSDAANEIASRTLFGAKVAMGFPVKSE